MNDLLIVVEGCPVASGGRECLRGCGGHFRITSDALTKATVEGRIDPDKLCGTLSERVEQAVALLGVETQTG
jgi:hypothetical protein